MKKVAWLYSSLPHISCLLLLLVDIVTDILAMLNMLLINSSSVWPFLSMVGLYFSTRLTCLWFTANSNEHIGPLSLNFSNLSKAYFPFGELLISELDMSIQESLVLNLVFLLLSVPMYIVLIMQKIATLATSHLSQHEKINVILLSYLGLFESVPQFLLQLNAVSYHDLDFGYFSLSATASLMVMARALVVYSTKWFLLTNVFDAEVFQDVQRLHYGCTRGEYPKVRAMISKYPYYIDLEHYNKQTPIYGACKNGHTDVVDLLIRKKANVNHQDVSNATPLFTACRKGHSNIVKALIKAQAEVNISTNNSETPLFAASRKGFTDIVGILLDSQAVVDHRDVDGATSLFMACVNNHKDIVSMLIENSADVDVVDCDGSTALFDASQNGHVEIIMALLHHNADINHESNKEETALFIACKQGNYDVVTHLVLMGIDVNHRDEDGASALFHAAVNGHVKIVKYLYDYGANLDVVDDDGATVLFDAIQNHSVDVVKFLLGRVDVNQQAFHGESALFVAAKKGFGDIVTMLLKADADVNLTDRDGATPLFYASIHNRVEVLDQLLRAKANVNHVDNDGATALFDACQKGFVEVASKLLEFRITVNHQDKSGASSLFVASLKGHKDVIMKLLNANANVNLTDQDGATALFYAAMNNQLEIIILLVEHGAEINAEDKYGETAIFDANHHGHAAVVEYLRNFSDNIPRPNEDGKGEVHVVQERDREEQMALALQMMSNLIEDKDVRGVLPNEYVEGIEILCSRTADQLTRDDYFYIYDDDECVKMIAELETNCALIEAYQVATRDVFQNYRPEVKRPLKDLMATTKDWGFHVFALARYTDRPLTYVSYQLLRRFKLLQKYNIPDRELLNFLSMIEKVYTCSRNPYHNQFHAIDVVQSNAVLLQMASQHYNLTDNQIFALLVACIIHDYAHPGFSNVFISKLPDSTKLSSGILENFHLAAALKIIKNPECNFLKNIDSVSKGSIISLIKELVMMTDLGNHLTFVKESKEWLDSGKGNPDSDCPFVKTHRGKVQLNYKDSKFLLKVCIKTGDVSNPSRPFDVYDKWADKILEEFYRQGDIEKSKKWEVSKFHDRWDPQKFACQSGFLMHIVRPLLDVLYDVIPGTREMISVFFDHNLNWCNQTEYARRSASQLSMQRTSDPSWGTGRLSVNTRDSTESSIMQIGIPTSTKSSLGVDSSIANMVKSMSPSQRETLRRVSVNYAAAKHKIDMKRTRLRHNDQMGGFNGGFFMKTGSNPSSSIFDVNNQKPATPTAQKSILPSFYGPNKVPLKLRRLSTVEESLGSSYVRRNSANPLAKTSTQVSQFENVSDTDTAEGEGLFKIDENDVFEEKPNLPKVPSFKTYNSKDENSDQTSMISTSANFYIATPPNKTTLPTLEQLETTVEGKNRF